MFEIEVTLNNESGLHARPASLLVAAASKFSSNIFIIKDEKEINAKSILGVLSIGAGKGTTLKIRVQGEDEVEAVEALKELVDNNFGE